jgi:hypothetical protein
VIAVSRHLVAVAALALVTIIWSFPLPVRLLTHLPGAGFSDNANFLWNFWWMREALGSGERFFSTPYLFAPFGTDLTLHTHTALNAFAGATLLERLPPLAAMNVTILASLFLNGFCTYVLAWRMTRDAGAAAIAGLVFGGSPYLAAHLNGHFNLTTAWTLPLFALAVGIAFEVGDPNRLRQGYGGPPKLYAKAERVALQTEFGGRSTPSGSTAFAIAAGVILGATAYIDYYYVVYEIAFAVFAFLLAAGDWSLVVRGTAPASRRLARVFAALAIVDVIVIAGILATGGFEATVAGVRILARDVFNPLQVFWILLAIAALARWRPAMVFRQVEGWRPSRGVVALATIALAAAVVALPVLINAAGVILRGEYVSQQYFWRNAPKGVDAATLLLGNPFHGMWGDAVRASYSWLEIDPIEGSAWLGIAPLILAAWTIRSHWHDRIVRYWTAIGVVFLVWALGPHLRVFGYTTGMILPQTLLRYIPIAANARVPGRAIVLVTLAVAVLSAIAISRSREPGRRRWIGVGAMALIILFDYLPTPFPTVEVDRPPIYETLRDRPERGALLELPVGIRDSFTGRGFLDHRALAYQMIHRRPIVGGVVSRISPSNLAGYAADPLIDGLLALSGRQTPSKPLPNRAEAASLLAQDGIAFVMLNRELASTELIEYVDVQMPLTLIASEGERSLFVVR